MYKGKRILSVIPARGGSKTLPRKNVLPFLGKPLIAWTIEAARFSTYLDHIVVSTDNKEIAAAAKQHGAEVPFMRPDELATDTAPTIDAVLHALDFFKNQGEQYDYVALLEPTSPLRKKDDIDNGIRTLIEMPDIDALVTLGTVHLEHPRIVKKVVNGVVKPYTDLPGVSQRQEADQAFFPYGVLYLAKTEVLRRDKTFYPDKLISMDIERWQNYEIDDEVIRSVTENVCRQFCLIPIDKIGKSLTLAMANPLNIQAIEDVELVTGCTVQTFVSTTTDIRKSITKYYKSDKK